MSNHQQDMRNTLTIGGPIGVVLRWGNQERVVRGIVTGVVRAAARVRFPEGNERLVHFKQLRLLEQLKPNGVNGHAATERPPAPKPVPALPLRPVPNPPSKPPSMPPLAAKSDVDAWVQMGRELLEPIETEIAQLRAEGEACDAEIEAIEDRRGEIVERLKALHVKREGIAKLVKLVDEGK